MHVARRVIHSIPFHSSLGYHLDPMDDVWSWLTTLPHSGDWTSNTPTLPLAASGDKSILLRAERTAGSNTATLVTFSLSLHGFHTSNHSTTLWLSDAFPLSPTPHIPLLLHLIHQLITLSPSSTPIDPLPAVDDPHPISLSPQAPALLSLALALRLFFLCCATSVPAEAGFLLLNSLPPVFSVSCHDALRSFFVVAGPDREERLMRSLGYMVAKMCILRDLGGGGSTAPAACPVYAAEAYGLWVLRGYAPVPAMGRAGPLSGPVDPEPVLRYSLAHQQLEAVVQLEYTLCGRDPRFIRVGVRVDNIRLHVVRLGFGKDDVDVADGERHFPSRVKLWVGPAVGSAYAVGPSLGRSTANPERVVETTRTVKGGFGGGKGQQSTMITAKARMVAATRMTSWRWEQEAEGGAGVVEGVLCDSATGAEVAGWRGGGGDPRGGMRRGAGRVFSKVGGVVVAGDELAEGMSWRVGRELEGKVVKWRMGVKVWVSYLPEAAARNGYYETRCVEWREEVELPLIV